MANAIIRKEQRLQAVLPVKITGIDIDGEPFQGLGHTLDVSHNGARLANVNVPLREGCVVRIQRGMKAANFRVVWMGEKGTRDAGRIGVECLEAVKNFWGLDRQEPVSKEHERVAASKRVVGQRPAR